MAAEGFKLYFGGVVKDGAGDERAFFLNIFDTLEEAERVSKKAMLFGKLGDLKGQAGAHG